VTGLIGGFLGEYFRIADYCARNVEQGIFRGEKPALIFPVGRPTGFLMACSTWQSRKTGFVFFYYFFIHDEIFGQMAMPRQKTGIFMVKGSLFRTGDLSFFRILPGMATRAQFWQIRFFGGEQNNPDSIYRYSD